MILIKIQTRNAAFDNPDYCWEVARILSNISARFRNGAYPEKERDTNGNTCVTIFYTERDRLRKEG